MVVGGYVGLYGCAFCAMGLSVPLNALCYEIQYSSTVTLILTEPGTQTKCDTKKKRQLYCHTSRHRAPHKIKFKVLMLHLSGYIYLCIS